VTTYYTYKALNQDGHVITGDFFAPTQDGLYAYLENKQLTLLSAKTLKTVPHKKIRPADFCDIFLKLSLLLEAGQTLHKALVTVSQTASTRPLKSFLRHIIAKLEQGQDFFSIAQTSPSLFPPVLLQYVKLGQSTGNLSHSFKKIHTTLSETLEYKQKIKKIMFYPLILFMVMGTMIFLFMSFLLPQLVEHLHAIGTHDLPLISRSLIKFADITSSYGWVFLLILGSAGGVLSLFPLSVFLQEKLTPILLHTPLIGYYVRQYFSQKWLLIVGQLYEAGGHFKNCLEEAKISETNPSIKKQWDRIYQAALEGKPLNRTLTEIGLFSPVVISLCELALHNGTLAQSLLKAHNIEFKETQHKLEMLLKTLEPAFLIILGGMLLWIALAVISPIYNFIPA